MSREELIKLGQHEVRKDKNLMLFYISEFEKMFGKKPVCAGCTFRNDWAKFVGSKKITVKNIDTNTTFVLKKKYNDKMFRLMGEGKITRCYGRNMSEGFATELLKIDGNEVYFEKVPEAIEMPAPKESHFDGMSRKELNEIAENLELNPKDYKKKSDIIDAIEKV